MGSISVGADEAWVVARWAFRGYLNEVLKEVRGDSELEYAIKAAIALDGLHLPLEDAAVVRRLAPVLLLVADEVISGVRPVRVEGRILDGVSQEQFREAVGELRRILPLK